MVSMCRISAAFAVFAVVVSAAAGAHAAVKILQTDESGKATIKKLDPNDPASGRSAAQPKTFTGDPTDPVNHFEPGELIVLNPPSGFASGIGGMGFKIVETARLDGLGLIMMRIEIPRGMTVPAARQALAARYPGATIDANHSFEAQAKGQDPRSAIGWPKASPKCGAGVKLGMIDSGVDIRHPALRGQRVEFRSFHRKDRKPGPKVHGTAVAAMLVGKPEWGGLLPGASLKAASMFETKKGGKKVGSAVALLKSLSWLAKSRVDAINLSVAGTDNKALRLAFGRAKKAGLVLIAAAGNWGRADRPAYPAAYKHVVAVTAVGTGKIVYRKANRGDYIDFAAPGVRIKTAVPGGVKIMSGTSFASPYITALVALDIAAGASRRISSLRKKLRGGAQDLGNPGKDKVFGYGFVGLGPKCR